MTKRSIYNKERKRVKNTVKGISYLNPQMQKFVMGIRPLSKAQKRKGKLL